MSKTMKDRIAELEAQMAAANQEISSLTQQVAKLRRDKLDISAASDVSEAVGHLRAAIELHGRPADWPRSVAGDPAVG
jgi:prefoldin subunit 5